MTTAVQLNDALRVNPQRAFRSITTGGSDFLYAVFAIMLLSDLAFIVWSTRRPIGQRVFHQLPIIILTSASLAYFAMASNLGTTPVQVEFRDGSSFFYTRAFWYARYIDWAITTPVLLLEILLATGLPLSDIVTLLFMDVVMIVSGLVGGLIVSRYKWGFFVFGMFALFYIWWVLLFGARRSANAMHPAAGSVFTKSAIFLSALWLMYPIAWGLSEGGNQISPNGEMIFYGVLDVLAKPVFCFFHVWSMRRIPYEVFALQSGKASTGINGSLSAPAPLNPNNANANSGMYARGGGVSTGMGIGAGPGNEGHSTLHRTNSANVETGGPNTRI